MNNQQQLTTFLNYLPLTTASSSMTANCQESNSSSGGIPCNQNCSTNTAQEEDSCSEENEPMQHQHSAAARQDQEDSGYMSDVGSTIDDTTSAWGVFGSGGMTSSSGGSLANGETGSGVSSLDLDEMGDISERIEFLQAKQDILEKASCVLLQPDHGKDLLTVQKASRRSRRQQQRKRRRQQQSSQPQQYPPRELLMPSSSMLPNSIPGQNQQKLLLLPSNMSKVKEEGNDEDDDEDSTAARANSIWDEAVQILETLNESDKCNKKSSSKKKVKSKKKSEPLQQEEEEPRQPTTTSAKMMRRSQQVNPKDPSIRIIGVKRVGSSAFDDGDYFSEACTSSLSVPPKPRTTAFISAASSSPPPPSLFVSLLGPTDGHHWMAKALIQASQTQQRHAATATATAPPGESDVDKSNATSRAQMNPDSETEDKVLLMNNGWEVVPSSSYCDPTYPLELLVPPRNTILWRSSSGNSTTITNTTAQSSDTVMTIDLNEATSPQTNHARLVTQATPPFRVVYANRVFLQLMGNQQNGGQCGNNHKISPSIYSPTQQQQGPPAVLGQPVESLIQVIHGLEENRTTQEQQEQSQIGKPLFPQHLSTTAAAATTTTTAPPQGSREEELSVIRTFGNNGTNGNTEQEPHGVLDSILLVNGIHCKIQVVPVVDRSVPSRASFRTDECNFGHTRGSFGTSNNTALISRDTFLGQSMSHVMVQVEQTKRTDEIPVTEKTPSTTLLLRPKPLRIAMQPLLSPQEHQEHQTDSKPSSNDHNQKDQSTNGPDGFLLGMIG